MDKQLRILAGAIVTESKLSKEAKLQLLNFIRREASEVQVKALLLDGKIIPKVDKQTKEIIEARFKNYNYVKNLSEKVKRILSKNKK